MTDVVPYENPLPVLATPGERLGWIFNDRNLYRRKYQEPPPQPAPVPPDLQDRADRAERGMTKRILVSLGAGLGGAVLIGCCGTGFSAFGDGGDDGVSLVPLVIAVLALIAGVAGAVYAYLLPQMARKSLAEAQEQARQDYAREYAAWDSRREWHDQEQQQRVNAMDEWGAATPSPGARRVDIVGGTTYGWEAVLTVFGGSLLASRGPMVLVDFTGEALCDELIDLAATTDRSVHEMRLPAELARFDLVGGLEPDELVDVLVEAMHGDATGASRADRSQDTLLLREICQVLAPALTMPRLLAALRVLTDRPGEPDLSPGEIERLLALQPAESRRQIHHHLRRIEAFVHPLSTMGTEPAEAIDADLTCLIAGGEGGPAQNELLKDLLVQWLSRQVRRESAPLGSLVLLGADEISHRTIERLSTLCERRGVRLVLFFAHLREDTLRTIGGGEVAFMRLGNHQEAGQAAEFIGRGHKFVLSQLTRTLGGDETHTLADTQGETVTKGGSKGKGYGRRGVRRSIYTSTWSKSRNWSQTESTAKGTNWADASAMQRVYEYTLEPRVLQDLPEYAMVMVKGQGRGSIIQAVEVDPAIVTLERVSMAPLEPEPLPDPDEAVTPATRQPSQVTVSAPEPLAGKENPGWGR
ncbi:MAG: hypothetical protein ABW046_23220 [Actinoplanes sp.]